MIVAAIFIALIVMICFNVPIAVALAISAILGLLYIEGTGSLVTVALISGCKFRSYLCSR